jgi:hypothetical protein
MQALQPSDRSRFKDASEAEQSLREAWDRCLTQGLVHPAVLAMDETPHDKVGARMHEVRTMARPSVPVPVQQVALDRAADRHDPNDVMTAIDTEVLPNPLVANTPLMIESKKLPRVGDDDPTMLQVRVEDMRSKEGAARAAERERPSGKAKVQRDDEHVSAPAAVLGSAGHAAPGSGGRQALDDGAKTQADESKVTTASTGRTIAEPAKRSRLPLIVMVIVLALASAAITMYLRGMIKFG